MPPDTDISSDRRRRVLVLLHTREVARQLTRFLQQHEDIQREFHPQMLVGHGGFDGIETLLPVARRGQAGFAVPVSHRHESLDAVVR